MVILLIEYTYEVKDGEPPFLMLLVPNCPYLSILIEADGYLLTISYLPFIVVVLCLLLQLGNAVTKACGNVVTKLW